MPFGLCYAPATFQRCMVAIFHDMLKESVEVFMVNLSIFGNSFDNCLNNLDKMLQRCKDANLVLNWEKCHFMVKEGIVLRHKVSGVGLEVDKAKINAKGDEGYFIGYSMSSKAFRVFNKRTRRVEENLHVEFLENKAIEKGVGPNWLFDINFLTKSMNYVPVDAGTNYTNLSGTKDAGYQEVKKDVSSLRYIVLPNWAHNALLESSLSKPHDESSSQVLKGSGNPNPTVSSSNPPTDQMEKLTVESPIPTVSSPAPTAYLNDSPKPSSEARLISKRVANQEETPSLDNILSLIDRFEDILRVTTSLDETIGMEADVRNMKTSISASPTPTLRIHKDHPKSQIIGPVDTPIQTRNKSKMMEGQKPKKVFDALPIGTKRVLKNKKDEKGIVFKNKARLVAQRHTQEEGIDYDEVFALVARIKAIKLFLAYASFMGFIVYQMVVKSVFLYGTIDEEVYVMQPPGFQDPAFLAKLCREFEALMHEKFQMSAMGELNFFLGLQVLQKEDGIFLSHDKVFNKRTRRVEENLHVEFLENKSIEKGTKDTASQEVKKDVSSLRYIALPNWVHDALLESSSSKPQDGCSPEVPEGSRNTNPTASTPNPPAKQMETLTSEARLISKRVANQEETPSLDNILSLTNRFKDILGVTTSSNEAIGVKADVSNMETTISASHTPTLNIHKDHPKSQIIGPVDTPIQTRHKSKKVSDALQDPSWVEAMQEELFQFKIQKDERGIVVKNKASLVAQGHTQEERIDYDEVFTPVARIEAIRLLLAYALFMGFTVYQMDVKSAFLYGTIDEEVYVMQSPRFQDPEYPARVYRVEKAMYGLQQAPRAWYGTLSKYLLSNGFQRGTIDQTLFIRRQRVNFILVQVYVDDIIFRSSNPQLCKEFEALMHEKFQMSAMVKRIFRYLKGHPKLGLWYPKASTFDLVAYSDSDYGGASQDHKSTTGGKYVAAASCCGQVLWIQNQLLDYGYNFMNTKIYIDNNSAICIVKNPVYHSKTKHIEIKNHFIRDCFEKKLISVDHIYTDENVADLLTKAFDAGRFQYLVGEFNSDFHPMVDFIAASPLSGSILYLLFKSTGFNEFSNNIATALVWLATNRTSNFSKMIFDGIVKNINNKTSKFLMYPRFLTKCLRMSQFVQISHTHQYVVPFHTKKLFTTLRVNSPSFSSKIVPLFDTMLVHQGEGSGTPTKPHHTPFPEANTSSHLTTSSIPLPSIPTAPIPPVTQPDPTPIRQYSRRARIAQSSALPTVADEPASPVRDVSEGEACPTDYGFIADQDRGTIAKSSTLPYDSAPRVTSPVADEGSMQHNISELTALCTSLQRQHSKLQAKFQAQEEEIVKLKERVKVLEDKEDVAATQSGDDAPIKVRSINEGEAAAKRISNDLEEIARVLISMDAATVLAGGIDVPTGSGFILTAGPPATGKEVMVESDTPKKKKLQEQIDAYVVRELEEQQEKENIRMNKQIARDAEVVRIHAEEELQGMIDSLDKSNETIAKYLQEYQDFASELPLEKRIELIIYKFHSQQRRPMTKKQKREYYIAMIKSNLGWRLKDLKGMKFEEIEAKFDEVWKQVEDFIPMGLKEEAERLKRKGLNLEKEQVKKQKLSEEAPEIETSTEEFTKEKMKEMMQLVPVEDVYVQALQFKHLIIDWKVHTEGQRSYWEDLNQLWALVKEYLSIRPAIKWKLYDLSGVHHLTAKDKEIFMLVEKDYPLRKGLALVMICYKFQVENYSQMAEDLIRKIYNIANSPRQQDD
nr:hypothetical protein [Tanacetum cinerariifolium]